MAEYKLTYFNTFGIAEPIRFIFEIAAVPYEDIRFPKDENWPYLLPDVKATLPWGTIPVLEYNGKKLSQSRTIARFLARKFNMTGVDEMESAKCDEIVDALNDFLSEWLKLFYETDDAKKAEITKNLQVVNSKYLRAFDNILASKEGKWLVGSDLTWADVYVAHFMYEFGKRMGDSFLNDYPNLKNHVESFITLPKVKEWMDKRPKEKEWLDNLKQI